jgi:hypothetical protein
MVDWNPLLAIHLDPLQASVRLSLGIGPLFICTEKVPFTWENRALFGQLVRARLPINLTRFVSAY